VRAPSEVDPAVLQAAQVGDRAACRALVERYQRRVAAVIARVLAAKAHPQIVEDLAQETFLRVFRALPRFDADGPARLSTWILTIATRVAIDELRSGRLVVDHVPLDAPELPESALAEPGRSPDAVAEAAAVQRAVVRAVEGLPAEQRAAFVLRVFHDLDYEEIALALDVDIGTVKSRIARTRERLRALLPEHRHD
jgi:RNA polymerase sigma-70 factor (ECF subfamily)